MINLSVRNQLVIGLVLVLLMIATRGHHISSLHNLPGASWAVFFLAGVYLHALWPLAGFFILTWILDFSAYTWGGASDFCMTFAYAFLLPAYCSLWYAGRWYAHQYQFEFRTLIPLFISLITGAFACELFSSGGFYFFSGHFEETTLVEFGYRVIKYFPHYIGSLMLYTGIAAVIHTLITLTRDIFRTQGNGTV